jgi:uncharacterized protein YjbI with pentapeptide repeats
MTEEKSESREKPEAPDWLIDNIAEASKNTRKIYLLYLGFLAYCALTAISTNDRTLVLNEPAHLPIVNVGVPLEGFFIFAPILAILTFLYLQLYLQNLNGMKKDLENKYVLAEKKRLYPWIINIIDDPEPGLFGFIQQHVVYIALWWTLPLVLMIFAITYVKKHDEAMSYYLGSLPIMAILLSLAFRQRYESLNFFTKVIKVKPGSIIAILIILAQLFFLACIIPWSMQGGKNDFFRRLICVDLSYQKLITEPETDYEGLYWVDFSGVHLEGANLAFAILKRANLTNAHLDNAFLPSANFQEANLDFAELRGSNMLGINLQGAALTAANLEDCILERSDLRRISSHEGNFQKAILREANFDGAFLQSADFDSATLWGASFQGSFLLDANFRGAELNNSNFENAELAGANFQNGNLYNAENLTINQLSNVKTLYGAKMDDQLLEQVKSQYPHLLEPPEEEEEKSSP